MDNILIFLSKHNLRSDKVHAGCRKGVYERVKIESSGSGSRPKESSEVAYRFVKHAKNGFHDPSTCQPRLSTWVEQN